MCWHFWLKMGRSEKMEQKMSNRICARPHIYNLTVFIVNSQVHKRVRMYVPQGPHHQKVPITKNYKCNLHPNKNWHLRNKIHLRMRIHAAVGWQLDKQCIKLTPWDWSNQLV